MDTTDYIIISSNVITNISNVNTETDIPSDHCTMTATPTSDKLKIRGQKYFPKTIS